MSCGPSYVANTSLSTLNGLKTDENKSRRRKLRFKIHSLNNNIANGGIRNGKILEY